ncbi:hypothetical protein PIB30_082447 [Stylosanthes scabra]|uniref:Uncharacterized protein n=1 Tax=Stylosanthes scabra TaxID=79078 RepID=A0ABU6RRZ0_9FABA|nr:hypothetical protein [Stylosanthes scabra]
MSRTGAAGDPSVATVPMGAQSGGAMARAPSGRTDHRAVGDAVFYKTLDLGKYTESYQRFFIVISLKLLLVSSWWLKELVANTFCDHVRWLLLLFVGKVRDENPQLILCLKSCSQLSSHFFLEILRIKHSSWILSINSPLFMSIRALEVARCMRGGSGAGALAL